MAIESIAAVTLITANMKRAVTFYRALGFELRYGGEEAAFTSLVVGGQSLNLEARADPAPITPWGRVILFVADVDAVYEKALSLGMLPSTTPRDAPWGERFFHLTDPDGHELSFAKPLDRAPQRATQR